MNNQRDMSDTFVSDIGQRSAVAEEIENLEEYDDSFKVNQKNSSNDFNNSSNKKKNKKNPIWTILLVILALVIGAGGSYYYFEVLKVDTEVEDTTTSKKEEEDKTVSNSEELKPEGVLITELINRYDVYNISNTEIYDNLYAQESITPSQIDKEYIKLTGAKRAISKGNQIISTSGFTSEEYQQSLKELYGNQVTIEDGNIGYPTYIYHPENKMYFFEAPEVGGTTSGAMLRKNVKAIKTDDKIEVNVAVAIVDYSTNKVYKGKEDTNEIEGLNAETFDIDTSYSKLNQYKYTFDYDSETDNYILSSIELIK